MSKVSKEQSIISFIGMISKQVVHMYNEWCYPTLPPYPSPCPQHLSGHLYTLHSILLMVMRYIKHVLYEHGTIIFVHVKQHVFKFPC